MIGHLTAVFLLLSLAGFAGFYGVEEPKRQSAFLAGSVAFAVLAIVAEILTK